MHIIEQLYKFVDTQHAEDYSHYCDVLKLRGKIFFNEVYANFTYVEDFDSNQDAALGHFLDGLTPVEDEAFVTIHHPMTKEHFLSFVAFVTSDRIQLVKLYPEGNAETQLQLRGMGYLYYYCNRHGLFRKKK
jgi:hypothetical protein